jgi:hypothetical protein
MYQNIDQVNPMDPDNDEYAMYYYWKLFIEEAAK